mgnify:CR=1 FL=1
MDARHAQFSQWCRESGEAKGCDLPKWALALMPQAAQLEFAAMEQTQEQIRQSPPFPAVPVAVLTGTRKPFTNQAFRAVWLQSQTQLAQLAGPALGLESSIQFPLFPDHSGRNCDLTAGEWRSTRTVDRLFLSSFIVTAFEWAG